ncbi:ABC transporter ATP-binding protein [Streptomyces echinoruber]|uniref:ABC transporter ATP-binding protein n=1 Tax=Streptomyces echinoruber TaxID=68898 RepID=UPI003570F9B7
MNILDLSYQVDGRKLLDRVNLTVHPGESVAVTGPSGSGKSTLLMCVLGLIKPRSGTVRVNDRDLTSLSGGRLTKARRELLGMVFQFGELLPELTPVENVALPVLLGGGDHEEAYRRAASLLDELGVPAGSTPTGMLSGGERQRAAVARALIARPAVLLADEPTGALDPEAKQDVAHLLFSTARHHNCALLLVTHDESVADQADRRHELRNGVLTEVGVGS